MGCVTTDMQLKSNTIKGLLQDFKHPLFYVNSLPRLFPLHGLVRVNDESGWIEVSLTSRLMQYKDEEPHASHADAGAEKSSYSA